MPTTYLSNFSKGRDNNFDFLRFLFATLVIYSHSFPLLLTIPVADRVETFRRLTLGQASGGEIAVDGFFVISGFLITKSWLASRGLGDYFRKRVLRIYPGFIVAVLLSAFVVGPIGARSASTYMQTFPVTRFVKSVVLLEKPAHSETLAGQPVPYETNGSLWTIKYEFACYILVAALGIVGLIRRRSVVLLIFAGVLATQFFIDLDAGKVGGILGFIVHHKDPLRFLCFFVAGMILFLFDDRIPVSKPAVTAAAVLTAASVFVHALALTLPTFGAYLLLCVALNKNIPLQGFARRGDLSYGIYLYAWPIQQLLVFAFGQALSPFTLFITAFPLVCVCAAMSWNLVERPFLQLKNRVIDIIPENAAVIVETGPAQRVAKHDALHRLL